MERWKKTKVAIETRVKKARELAQKGEKQRALEEVLQVTAVCADQANEYQSLLEDTERQRDEAMGYSGDAIGPAGIRTPGPQTIYQVGGEWVTEYGRDYILYDQDPYGDQAKETKRIIDDINSLSNQAKTFAAQLQDYLELLHLIERAAKEKHTKLEYRGNHLAELPSEIEQLGDLNELVLEGNQLTELPKEIGQMTNLKSLHLRKNKLTTLPPEIGQLFNLTNLDLRDNELTTLPPEIGQLNSLTSLSLWDNKLKRLPKEIARLTRLTTLDLTGNDLTDFPVELVQLTSLVTLSLSDNRIRNVPAEIAQLANLTTFELGFTQVTDLPPEIGQLNSLTLLYLSGNQLTGLPPEIRQLTNLTSLAMRTNRLQAIPPEIFRLTNLSDLDLSSNQLRALPAGIGQLVNLTSLQLGGNQLITLPSEIGQLTNLDYFGLDYNSLRNIPSEIGRLTKLTRLNLFSNQLTDLPVEIRQLTSMTSLDLGFNQLRVMPTGIEQLTSLTSLNLSDNQLITLPSEIGRLTKLANLDLRNNRLEHLPTSLLQLTELKKLNLQSNRALGISPEILQQANNPLLILRACFGESRPLYEAKMLFVGQGGVGKTALARRLIHDLPPDDKQGKTQGVDIHKWSIAPMGADTSITLNLWDFGGQGVYQATHQFFFTSRSLYLVVINARTGEQESRLHHWLKLVSSLSNNAPVIIVINKQDEHALSLNDRDLKHKYPNLLDVIPTSCTTGAGISLLKQAIARALTKLPHIYDRFTNAWLDLKAQLEVMDANYITYERYQEYCRSTGIENGWEQRSWLRVLHDLGVILNYQDDSYRQLQGTYVLKPEWVTDGVYRVLSDPHGQIAQNGGILVTSMLDSILDSDEYPRHQQHFIMEMMRKFELSFLIPLRQNQYLIPDLLPNTQPDIDAIGFSSDTSALRFEYHYSDFLPETILSRFMVGMMTVLDRQISWRQGAVLSFDNNHALVRADWDARRIFITVTGVKVTRRSMLNSIRMQLHVIHNTFPNLEFSERVPIPDHPGSTIDYDDLCWYESQGELNPLYAPIRGRIDVKTLLDGVETPALRRERQLQEMVLEGYNLDELAQLCFDLNVDYEDLPGQTRTTKSRELIQFMGRNGRLDELEVKLTSRAGM